ncbi:hypothetical protein AAFF_G00371340 [Aldrovandia affinis]|uniref:Uncharacterized protein n=1 Tax=Aldrovandia affinis TaxID=143900 RepID=A0AAD7WN90_9TELE|nr:hypothetical protein AAFF_G00371340 [Aldrovandia affinis]
MITPGPCVMPALCDAPCRATPRPINSTEEDVWEAGSDVTRHEVTRGVVGLEMTMKDTFYRRLGSGAGAARRRERSRHKSGRMAPLSAISSPLSILVVTRWRTAALW